MTISPFRYPGAKNKILPILMDYIDNILINQDRFIDLFVGGGSVLLEVARKYPNINLYANDKDYWISSFWKIVAGDDSKKLSELLSMVEVVPTLEQFYKLRETTSIDDVDCAYRAIFFNRTTFSGIFYSGPIGGKEQKSKYTIDCRYNSKKLQEKILNCHKLLNGRTKVSNLDFSQYKQFINTNYPIYADPPYYIKGHTLYIQYMKAEEHENLSNLFRLKNNWVLSYDDCPEVRNLYKNNTIIDLSARYCINGKKDNWESKNELIILP